MSTPRIYIDGRELAASRARALRRQPIGVAAVTIPWGRAAHTDNPESHVATIKLIERGPLATFPRHGSYVGSTVRVDSPLAAKTVFLGQVTDTAARAVALPSGPAVEVTLTCIDRHGVLSQLRPRGPYDGFTVGTSRRYPGAWKIRGYPQERPINRLINLTELGELDPWVGPISIASSDGQLLDGVQADDIPDAWTLMKQAHAIATPLGTPRFTEFGMTTQRPATAAHIDIIRAGSMLDIRPDFATTVPASTIRVPSPDVLPDVSIAHKFRRVKAHLAKRIVNLEITGNQQRSDVEDASEELTATIANHGGSHREYSADLGAGASITKLDGNEQPGAWLWESTPRATESETDTRAHVRAIADMVGNLNQFARLPALTVVEGDLPSNLNRSMFDTLSSIPLWLAGNIWATMPQMPRLVQMLGGELTWTGTRWEHTISLAATIDHHGKSFTFDEAFGHLDDTIDNWAPTATVSMLADVTRTTAT